MFLLVRCSLESLTNDIPVFPNNGYHNDFITSCINLYFIPTDVDCFNLSILVTLLAVGNVILLLSLLNVII